MLAGLGFTEEIFGKDMRTLQGGFKLRVLLAQVLFAHPDILLLDEPTNHLDMESIEWLVELLARYEGFATDEIKQLRASRSAPIGP